MFLFEPVVTSVYTYSHNSKAKRPQHVWLQNQIKIMFDKIEWRLWKFMTILPAPAHRDRQKPGPDYSTL